jgi:hypothetical protein
MATKGCNLNGQIAFFDSRSRPRGIHQVSFADHPSVGLKQFSQ